MHPFVSEGLRDIEGIRSWIKCILCVDDRKEFAVYCDLKAQVDEEGLLACRRSVSWSLSTSLTPHSSPFLRTQL